jgi:hypothetical protein
MSSIHSLDISQIQKGLHLIDLKVSETDLQALQSGNMISLGDQRLGEIGSILILTEALALVNFIKSTTLGDLMKASQSPCTGIPIYCWNSEQGKCCLCLIFIDGNLAITTRSEFSPTWSMMQGEVA